MGACVTKQSQEFEHDEEKYIVDENRNRINRARVHTDILIAGYMRQVIERMYQIFIPSEIKNLCFDYWYIPVCDTWNRQFTHSCLQINQQILQVNLVKPHYDFEDEFYFSGFGDKIISSCQIHTWRLRITGQVRWFRIGVIKNDETTLKQRVAHYDYDLDNGCWLAETGEICGYSGCGSNCYIDAMSGIGTEDDDILMMIRVDLNKYRVSYKINDKDY
eukprot:128572_1